MSGVIDEFLRKPVSSDALLKVIEKYIQRSEDA